MYRLCLFVVLLPFCLQAEPDATQALPVSEVAGEPSALIAGHVNAITGTFSEQQTDVALAGIESLLFQRYYNSSDWNGGYLCDSWGHNHGFFGKAELADDKKYCKVTLPQGCGGNTIFHSNKKADRDKYGTLRLPKDSTCLLKNPMAEIGLTNTCGGEISGRTNLKSTQVELRRENAWALDGDGSVRYFEAYPKKYRTDETWIHCNLFLRNVNKPSGNKLEYYYNDNRLTAVGTKNAAGKEINWIQLDYLPRRAVNVRTSEGKTVQYQTTHLMRHGENSKTQGRYRLSKVVSPDRPTVSYEYAAGKGTAEQMVCKSGPDNRFLKVFYYQDFHYSPRWLVGRAIELSAPVGTDATAITTHAISYLDNRTEVRDALNQKTIYHYQTHRLTEIQRFTGTSDGAYTPYNSDRFYWGDQNTDQRSSLVCRALTDGQGKTRSCRILNYDHKYNISSETLYGNVSGQSFTTPNLDSNGSIQGHGCESVTTHFTYSNDRFNLLMSEREENGRTRLYEYKPDTDLLTAKFVADGGQNIVSREFHQYNEDAVRVRSVNDDGSGRSEGDLSGVTYRHITIVEPRMTMPGVGLPLQVQQRYLDLDTGKERQLHRHVNHYNNDLQIVRQDHYDADDRLRYSLTWEYDAMGNVVRETDALGQVTERKFDANNNKIFEKTPQHAFATRFQYDFSNRCICQEQIYPDGSKRAHTFTYDTLGQKRLEVDYMGRETRYDYDCVGHVIATHWPDGSVTRQEYDIAGNVTASIDANGHRKEMRYTLFGKVAETRYPDGSVEQAYYNKDSTVARAIALNGMETIFSYDTLGQVIRKESLSPGGTQQLAVTSATYKGSQVTSETDAMGHVTYYRYDGAGRQVAITKFDSYVEYGYDALGNRNLVCEWLDDRSQCRATLTTYDVAGRVIEERVEDKSGLLLKRASYGYDSFGHRISVTQETGTEKGAATTLTDYDADHRPVRVTNPLGQATVMEYDDQVRDASGRRVLQTRTTDALGNQIWSTQNVRGHVVEELRKDKWGALTAKRLHRHDANGNILETVETVIAAGQPNRDVRLQYAYDSMNRNTSTIEAVGTSEERVTYQHYNREGQQVKQILPDGLTVHFTYDHVGRVHEYYSSDSSIHYWYHYDRNNNVVKVVDRIHDTETCRTYDAANRIRTETLDNGVTLAYQYDSWNRVRQLTLPDQSGIRYSYNPLVLQSVERLGADGQPRYAHTYSDYDLTGHAGKATLIGKAGEVTYTTDILGRPLTMLAPRVEERIAPADYDPVGNLLAKELRDPLGTVPCRYAYDTLYQLTEEFGVAQHRYRYDSVNNRLAKDDAAYEVNVLNQLKKVGDTYYQYDRRGCRSAEIGGSGGGVQYRYDALNRLTSVDYADKRVTYTYDSFNRRLSATSTDAYGIQTRQRFMYVGQDEIGVVDDNNHIVQLRLLGNGRGAEIGAAVAIELGNKVYAPISDSSGHIVALLNADDGTFAEGYRYSAFGEVTSYNIYGWWWRNQRVGNPWQFSSKRLDPVTGLLAFGRRDYDPAIGRWITPDPLGYQAGPNLYAYVMNNPLTHFDLYGLATQRSGRELPERTDTGVTRSQYNYGRMTCFLRHCVRLPGQVVESLGRDVLPIPLVREVTMGVGRLLQVRPFFGCEKCREFKSQNFSEGVGYLAPDQRQSEVNGMGTTLYQASATAKELSAAHQNAQIDQTYSATCGFTLDLVKVAWLKMGVVTREVQILADTWRAQLADMDANGYTEGRIRHLAHSRGGLVTWVARKLMTEGELKRIDVETYGTAKIIPNGVFGSATNYISKWDAVPALSCPIDYTRARMGLIPNVVFLDRKSSSCFDHAYDGDTYLEARTRATRTYIHNIKLRHR